MVLRELVMQSQMTLDEMEYVLGASIRKLRLQKNLDRVTLAKQSGVSVSAIKNLELGNGSTTNTLLSVLRTLGRADWLDGLAPVASINPLHMVKNKTVRQRASGRRGKTNAES